jgi:hypothetical protein
MQWTVFQNRLEKTKPGGNSIELFFLDKGM